jgi:hypothetical protein
MAPYQIASKYEAAMTTGNAKVRCLWLTMSYSIHITPSKMALLSLPEDGARETPL